VTTTQPAALAALVPKEDTMSAPTTTTAGVETVGAVVRGPYGNLGRITEVLEYSRLSPNHLSAPGAVVVRLEPLSGFAHRSAWSNDLTLSQPGDVGSYNAPGNRYVPASWA
jgi:hypothetical protein